MLQTVKELLTSKKFIVSVSGMIVALVAKLGLELQTEDVAAIVSPVVAYVVAQGWADRGKEAEKIKTKEIP